MTGLPDSPTDQVPIEWHLKSTRIFATQLAELTDVLGRTSIPTGSPNLRGSWRPRRGSSCPARDATAWPYVLSRTA